MRLDETAGESIASAQGGGTDEDDRDERDGHDDPLDPGKGDGGHVLVAVDEVGGGAVLSSAVSRRQRGSAREPEDPSGVRKWSEEGGWLSRRRPS